MEKMNGGKKKAAVMLLAILFLSTFFIITGSYFYKSKKGPSKSGLPAAGLTPPQSDRRPFPQDQTMAKIGSETIFGGDLNYKLSTYYRDRNTENNRAQLTESLIEEAKLDSALIQLGIKNGLISPDEKIFNNPGKDYELREKTLSELRSKLSAGQEKVDGAMISVWYYNMKPPKMDLDEAQKIASASMRKIHDDLQAGKITFKQAADRIINTPSLAQLDTQYKINAYSDFRDSTYGKAVFTFHELNEAFWKLSPGEISPVINVSYLGNPGEFGEAFYAIVKMEKRDNPGKGSLLMQLKDFVRQEETRNL